MTSNQSSANIPGLSTKTPFTVLAIKRSEIFAGNSAAKATSALRRKALLEHSWPVDIGRQLSVMHDGGFTFYVTWPDEIDDQVFDLEFKTSSTGSKAASGLIHKFINTELDNFVKEYDFNIGLTVDQFAVGVL